MFPREALPDKIGPYKIVRHLSSRGGADLYLGEHLGPMGFQRTCVLKLVPAPGTDDVRSAQELAHEAKICSRLNHPAIVRMHDFFEHGDRLVLVFEHFAGVTLARLLAHLRRRRVELPDSVSWYISHQLFSGLAHAHSLVDEQGNPTPVVHRDVQPAHIVISNDGMVRLTGFGIAKIAGTVGDTAVGFVKGTPAYMAPEQARGEKVTERADVYAAGLVVWEMLTGRSAMPRDARPGAELLRMISGRRVEPVSAQRTDIPREIAAAIDACLELSADKRSIRCADVERWLKKVVDVNAGRDMLRERIVQMRNVAMREPAPAAAGTRNSSAPRPSEPARVPPRFPGMATRLTGRVSAASATGAPTTNTAPAARRVPAVKGSRASVHAPPLVGDEAPSAGHVRSGGLPRSPELSEALRAPRLPSMPDADASVPSPQPVRSRPPAAATKTRGRTLLGVAPPAEARAEAPAPSFAHAAVHTPQPTQALAASSVETAPEPKVVVVAAAPVSSPQAVLGVADLLDLQQGPLLPGETTQLSRRRKVNRGVWMAAVVVGATVITALAVVGIASLRGRGGEAAPVASATASAPTSVVPAAVVSASAAPVKTETAPAASLAASAPVVASAAPKTPLAAAEPAAAATGSTSPITQEIQIPAGWGVVQVHSPPSGVVYVHGVKVGETDQPALAPCGRRYVRVGTAGPGPGLKGVSWLAPGQSIQIPCGKMVEISATPDHPIKDKPNKPDNSKRGYVPKSAF